MCAEENLVFPEACACVIYFCHMCFSCCRAVSHGFSLKLTCVRLCSVKLRNFGSGSHPQSQKAVLSGDVRGHRDGWSLSQQA